MAVAQLPPVEAQTLLKERGPAAELLDVREPSEYALVHVQGARHIPMGQIPGRLEELDSQRTYVVMCHHGGRSQRVAEFLAAQGYQAVNLAGGIDAWAADLEPSLPRY
ncbi:MAG TPA: rhodanese-like domain-containing protein [Gammaproteobacteria bacterium]